MSELARRQLALWAARYRGLVVALVALAVVVAVFPSVAPEGRTFDGTVAQPASTPPPSTPGPAAVALPPTVPPPPGAPPPVTADPVEPVGTDPGAIAPPPAPPTDTVPCPIDLPAAAGSTEPLPLADVLNLASPVLPLLGPFVPFGLAGLPAVGPILPVVTPLLPVAEPVLVFLGPLAARTLGPLVEFEAILLEPIEAPIEQFTPEALAAQQAFIAQLQPVVERITATGVPTCGAILVGSLAGVLQQTILDTGIGRLLDDVLRALEGLT